MVALVTLAEAKTHLRIVGNDHDDDVTMKALQASEIVMDYLKRDAAEEYWDDETVPTLVKAAVLLALGSLFANREGGDPISEAVKSILHRYRDPALA